MSLDSFPTNLRALVIGSTGAIGAAFVRGIRAHRADAQVIELHRHSTPAIDFTNEQSIERAAQAVAPKGLFHLIINATGILHGDNFMPEKKLADLEYQHLKHIFEINTFGPALVMRYFTPLLDRERGVMALLSAKVGSIEDNRLGGWYSYRASKAALNMLVKTAAIELKRSQKNAVLLALHPGTVQSALSQPFRGGSLARNTDDAVTDMLNVINQKTPDQSGNFYTYDAQQLPW
ncbi:SDR family NAD(P)-dependent oxidoreductase [Undibacterium sp. SXout11W]|uniref:SDR family NAD(P)-dependent oxidoreductase n=1 Tax=Undibacterium sp. SXout11W TaxID=3413050 RepID=UPI003BEF7C93